MFVRDYLKNLIKHMRGCESWQVEILDCEVTHCVNYTCLLYRIDPQHIFYSSIQI